MSLVWNSLHAQSPSVFVDRNDIDYVTCYLIEVKTRGDNFVELVSNRSEWMIKSGRIATRDPANPRVFSFQLQLAQEITADCQLVLQYKLHKGTDIVDTVYSGAFRVQSGVNRCDKNTQRKLLCAKRQGGK